KVLCLGVTVLLGGVTPGREEIPACATGRFRIWGNHLYARLDQIIPILVPFSDQKIDCGGVRGTVIREALLPVLRDEVAVGVERVDICGERKCHDVRSESINHGTRLFTRAAV